jgi:energy-coupling factor transporter transmembrane protein EcfT
MRTTSPGFVLAAGLAVLLLAATAPAGIDGRPTPVSSWIIWGAVPLASAALIRSKRGGLAAAGRQLVPLLPTVAMLTLPAVLFAAASNGVAVGAALFARAFATASAGLATVAFLGPLGLIAGLRGLRLPDRLVEVFHATLVGLTAVVQQAAEMLRATSARGPGHAPWSDLSVAPGPALRGFSRIIAALLLRSLERAEALERARRARGAGSW